MFNVLDAVNMNIVIVCENFRDNGVNNEMRD